MKKLKKGLRSLEKQGLLFSVNESWDFTEKGEIEGKRMVRLHRLWELFTHRHLHLAANKVHETAEQMEHLISPEIERALLQKLEYPQSDPHNSPIPYSNPKS